MFGRFAAVVVRRRKVVLGIWALATIIAIALPMVPKKFQDSADPRNLETAIAQTEPENADVYARAWQEVLAQ